MFVGVERGMVCAANNSLESAQTPGPLARAHEWSPAGTETSIAHPLGPTVARGNTLSEGASPLVGSKTGVPQLRRLCCTRAMLGQGLKAGLGVVGHRDEGRRMGAQPQLNTCCRDSLRTVPSGSSNAGWTTSVPLSRRCAVSRRCFPLAVAGPRHTVLGVPCAGVSKTGLSGVLKKVA